MASKGKKTKTSIWKLETMTPLGNISLKKIFEKIPCMFMKQRCGQAFQPFKGCFTLTSIKLYELKNTITKEGCNLLAKSLWDLKSEINSLHFTDFTLMKKNFTIISPCKHHVSLLVNIIHYCNLM